jgi:hypothetical protein
MMTAVWVAVVAAAAAFIIGVGVAVYVMLKAARLMAQSSAALAGLQQREDVLIDQASAAIDRVGEQIAMTETITATMDDVTASVAELRGRITSLAPATPAGPVGPGSSGTATWAAALGYGVARALGLRCAARYRLIRGRGPATQEAAARPAPVNAPGPAWPRPVRDSGPRPARVSSPRPARVSGPRPARGGERRAALTGRRGGPPQ